jgi:predicted O-methyltransferase YrrM
LIVLALAINFKGFTLETLYFEQVALKESIESVGGEVIFFGPGFEYPTNDVSEMIDLLTRKGRRPDVIISYLSENLFLYPLPDIILKKYSLTGHFIRFPLGIEKINDIPKVMWINDFWHMTQDEWDVTLLNHGFKHVIATYSPPFLRESDFRSIYSENVRKQVQFIPCPRGINTDIFHDYGEERSVDVTLLGAIGSFYPLRQYFHQTLSNQSWINYYHREHPGYNYDQTDKLTGRDYAKAIARSKIFVSCTGRYGIPFIKIYEVLACGTLLMCDRPCGAETLGLVDGKTYVEVDSVNFLSKLKYYLTNQEELKKIASAGQELFLSKYRLEHNARAISGILDGIVRMGREALTIKVSTSDSSGIPVSNTLDGYDYFNYSILKRAFEVLKRTLSLLRRSKKWNMRSHSVERLLPTRPQWEEIKNGSKLDWARVVEVKQSFELTQLDSIREMELVERYGLNYYWNDSPIVTKHAETVSVRPKVLQLLAEYLQARLICEIGTARGLQAIFWANYLESNHVCNGRLFTCDVVGHDEPVFRTPLSNDAIWTRRELWQMESVTSLINFVHGDSYELNSIMKTEVGYNLKIDLLYIDARHDEESVLVDYQNMTSFLDHDSVLVFDDCDPRFPGVESAVNQIAKERHQEIRLITFWPSPYSIAVIGKNVNLGALKDIRKNARF